MHRLISICIPCYNEEDNIELAHNRVTSVMGNLPGYDYEILFEDNASTDTSQDMLRNLAARDRHVRVILNEKNFGPGRSGTNCLVSAHGDAAVLLPCDLQDPPELIPQMIEKWESGYRVVWGQKESSEESGLMYRIRALYYHVLIDFAKVDAQPQVDGFGLYDRTVLRDAARYCDAGVGLRSFVGMAGYSVALLPYRQNSRQGGKSSYSIVRYAKLAMDTIVANSVEPIHLMMRLSISFVILSFLLFIGYLVALGLGAFAFDVTNLLLIIVIALLSLLMFFLAIVGRYLIRLREEASQMPLVFERERIGFDDQKGCKG